MSSVFVTALLIVVTVMSLSNANLITVRRPKIMGNKIPMTALLTNYRQTQRNIVKHHNFFRTMVKPPATNMLRMKWHKGAARSAQRWADECMFLTHDNYTGRHDPNYGSCGQNIFVSTQQVPWRFAMKAWFSERHNFTYGSPNNQLRVVGHYTQMVWASTHEVGCGFAKCYQNSKFSQKMYFNYVCNYCPAGNIPTKLGTPYRKGRTCRDCKKNCLKSKLCTNSCPYADLWSNCGELYRMDPDWLCKTAEKMNCRATCSCKGKMYDHW